MGKIMFDRLVRERRGKMGFDFRLIFWLLFNCVF